MVSSCCEKTTADIANGNITVDEGYVVHRKWEYCEIQDVLVQLWRKTWWLQDR